MYTIVIDESGDTGLSNVQADPSHGPSQYFCMSAAIYRDALASEISDKLEGFVNSKGVVHCAGMDHFKKVHLCQTVAQQPIGMLGVISNKLSLLSYLQEAKRSPTHYYNKVSQYLFERIGETIGKLRLPKENVRIHIEAREQQYSSLISFLQAIQATPLDDRALAIRNIDVFSIVAVKKKDQPLMSLADIGAHAMFAAVRRDSRTYGLNETRYLRELSPIFLCAQSGSILPKGLKPIHSLRDLALQKTTEAELKALTNENARFRVF